MKPVCLFDSGIGGLTVLKKLLEKFPNENYIYLADLANVPFGDKTKDEIKNIASEIIEWLNKFNPKLIIAACNTSSSVLRELGRINTASTIPFYGMIDSCVSEVAKSNYFQISVWATKLVVENNTYKNAIQKLSSKIKVEEIACPKLVPMIEDLNFNQIDKNEILIEYQNKTSRDSQALVLGCTHYPLVQSDLRKLSKLGIIDPADSLLRDLEKYIKTSKGTSPNALTNNQISLYATAQVEKLEKFAKLYLCRDFKVSAVSLGKATTRFS